MYKVYVIKTEDNKIYVGCTKGSLNGRMSKHRHLKMPFVLNGHSVSVVFETDLKEKAHQLEAELITLFDSTNREKGYNRRFGGSTYGFPKYVQEARAKTVKKLGIGKGETNPMWERHHSEETKEKIRLRALLRHPSTFDKCRKKTPEQLEKLQAGRARHQSENGHPMLGRKHSEQTKLKISETKRLKKLKSS